MSNTAAVTSRYTQTTVDQNGEVVSVSDYVTTKVPKEPPYVKMYLDTLMYLTDLPRGYSRILMAFLEKMSYANDPDEPMCIYVNAAMKRSIAAKLNISLSHVNNVLQSLVKNGIFARIERGCFQVNPHLFGRGEWKDISRLRMQVVFDANGQSINTEIERDQND